MNCIDPKMYKIELENLNNLINQKECEFDKIALEINALYAYRDKLENKIYELEEKGIL